MNTFPSSNSLSVSVRIYSGLLVMYPKTFRENYGTQMVQVFQDSFRAAQRRHGTSGVIDLWLHTCADLLVTALIERFTERSQYMFSPRIVVWGGIASVFGGLMWLVALPAWESGFTGLLLSLALLLTLGGLTALHARQGKQSGALGSSGLILGILGTTSLIFSIFQGAGGPLGMGILGIGSILIGLRAWQTRDLPQWRRMPLVLGIMYLGLAFSFWLEYQMSLRGIDAWNPTTLPAILIILLTPSIGIFWMILGAILAGDAGLQTSNHPPASA